MGRVSVESDMQTQLRSLARELVSDIAAADPSRSRELLSAFVSELVLAVADQSQREERRQKQAEGGCAGEGPERTARLGPRFFQAARREYAPNRIWRYGERSMPCCFCR